MCGTVKQMALRRNYVKTIDLNDCPHFFMGPMFVAMHLLSVVENTLSLSFFCWLLFAPLIASLTLPTNKNASAIASNSNGSGSIPATTSNNALTSMIPTPTYISDPNWNIWRTNCDDRYIKTQRCTIWCEAHDTACWRTANSIVRTCGPAWSSWEAVASGSASSSGSQWSKVTVENSWSGMPAESTTVLVYTTFSAANRSFVKQALDGGATTMTPVYAMGTPITSVSVDTGPPDMVTYMTAPTPDCKFVEVKTWNTSYCGTCRIQAGTVDLFYWPSATAPATGGAIATAESTAVISGQTFVSPSVYISLRTIYAQDACATVGRPHVGSVIALQSSDVSTIIRIGGKVAAYTTGPLDYDILKPGLPRAKEYQMLPSCIMFGCRTMEPMTWSPTLVAPSQVRTLDQSWAGCGLALEGL